MTQFSRSLTPKTNFGRIKLYENVRDWRHLRQKKKALKRQQKNAECDL
jgi:hypothetical protein